jgi:hypothetical protein
LEATRNAGGIDAARAVLAARGYPGDDISDDECEALYSEVEAAVRERDSAAVERLRLPVRGSADIPVDFVREDPDVDRLRPGALGWLAPAVPGVDPTRDRISPSAAPQEVPANGEQQLQTVNAAQSTRADAEDVNEESADAPMRGLLEQGAGGQDGAPTFGSGGGWLLPAQELQSSESGQSNGGTGAVPGRPDYARWREGQGHLLFTGDDVSDARACDVVAALQTAWMPRSSNDRAELLHSALADAGIVLGNSLSVDQCRAALNALMTLGFSLERVLDDGDGRSDALQRQTSRRAFRSPDWATIEPSQDDPHGPDADTCRALFALEAGLLRVADVELIEFLAGVFADAGLAFGGEQTSRKCWRALNRLLALGLTPEKSDGGLTDAQALLAVAAGTRMPARENVLDADGYQYAEWLVPNHYTRAEPSPFALSNFQPGTLVVIHATPRLLKVRDDEAANDGDLSICNRFAHTVDEFEALRAFLALREAARFIGPPGAIDAAPDCASILISLEASWATAGAPPSDDVPGEIVPVAINRLLAEPTSIGAQLLRPVRNDLHPWRFVVMPVDMIVPWVQPQRALLPGDTLAVLLHDNSVVAHFRMRVAGR